MSSNTDRVPEIVPPSHDADALKAILGKLDVCITRTEVAAAAAERAADAAARTETAVATMRGVVARIQNDHVSLRHGIPASWVGRLALVAAAATVGAMMATSIMSCAGGLRPVASLTP